MVPQVPLFQEPIVELEDGEQSDVTRITTDNHELVIIPHYTCGKTEFIKVHHQHPALWKVKSKEYVNENLKNQGYVTLLEICKKFDPSANEDYVCKKNSFSEGFFPKRTER
jgi:hypothetical protein